MGVNVSGGGASGGTPAPVFATTNAAGVATTFLRTDDQLAAFDATVPVTQASADAAAAGTAAVAARRDHRHGMPTIGAAGAITRAGGNTTEATTTSTSAVDVLTVASLSIATTSPITCLVAMRKTTGDAAAACLGLKLNTTVTGEATLGGPVEVLQFDTENTARGGSVHFWLGPRITDYNLVNSGSGFAPGTGSVVSVGTNPTITAAQPIATVTDVVIRGIVQSALITQGIDELQVETHATS